MEERDKWEYPGSVPSEGNQIVVSYNGDWLPTISGLLHRLMPPSVWFEPPSDIAEQVNDLIYRLSTPVTIQSFPTSAMFFPPQFNNVTGSDLEFIINTGSIDNGLWHRVTPAINDELNITFPLKAGYYYIEYGYAKSSAGGQVKISISTSVVFSTVEQYNGTTQLNRTEILAFEQHDDGDCTITLKVTGKNASSSGYVQNWSYLALRLQ